MKSHKIRQPVCKLIRPAQIPNLWSINEGSAGLITRLSNQFLSSFNCWFRFFGNRSCQELNLWPIDEQSACLITRLSNMKWKARIADSMFLVRKHCNEISQSHTVCLKSTCPIQAPNLWSINERSAGLITRLSNVRQAAQIAVSMFLVRESCNEISQTQQTCL